MPPLKKIKVKSHFCKGVRVRSYTYIRGRPKPPHQRKTNRPYKKTNIKINSTRNYEDYHREYYLKYLKRSNKS